MGTTVTKNKGGRPKKFNRVEEMQKKIDQYFKECDSNVVEVYDKKREEVVEMKSPKPYTVEGLCVVLDMDRVSLLNYEKDKEFFSTIKKAKNKILNNLAERSLEGSNSPAVSIFLLKNNYNYKDKTEVDLNADIAVSEITRKYVE